MSDQNMNLVKITSNNNINASGTTTLLINGTQSVDLNECLIYLPIQLTVDTTALAIDTDQPYCGQKDSLYCLQYLKVVKDGQTILSCQSPSILQRAYFDKYLYKKNIDQFKNIPIFNFRKTLQAAIAAGTTDQGYIYYDLNHFLCGIQGEQQYISIQNQMEITMTFGSNITQLGCLLTDKSNMFYSVATNGKPQYSLKVAQVNIDLYRKPYQEQLINYTVQSQIQTVQSNPFSFTSEGQFSKFIAACVTTLSQQVYDLGLFSGVANGHAGADCELQGYLQTVQLNNQYLLNLEIDKFISQNKAAIISKNSVVDGILQLDHEQLGQTNKVNGIVKISNATSQIFIAVYEMF